MQGIIIYAIFIIYIFYWSLKSLIDKLYFEAILGTGIAVLSTQIFIVANYAGQFLRMRINRDLNIALQSAGLIFLLLCLVLLISAFLSKRKTSSIVSLWGSTQVFLARGVYGIVRHPVNLGGILASLGIAMLMANIVIVGLGIIAGAAFFIASREEDRYSKETIGPEYATYMENVPAFNFVLGFKNRIKL